MPIVNKGNGITEVSTKAGKIIWLLPSQLMADLRGVALRDGIENATDDKWLLLEIRYAGEPKDISAGQAGVCWNCGDTKGFLAPTGTEDKSRARFREDHTLSPIHRLWREYPCPACQNPNRRLLSMIAQAGIADPEAALTRLIHWGMPGRDQVEHAVQEFTRIMVENDTAGMLTLAGPYGIGKTAMVEFIVVECIKANRDALYITAERFKQAVGDSVGGDEGAAAFLQRLKTAAVVVFDQVDWIREMTSSGQPSYTAEMFRGLFDHRYRLRRTHATVFTVNLEAWHHGGDDMLAAIYDRMREGHVAVMDAAGIRQHIRGMPVERDLNDVIT